MYFCGVFLMDILNTEYLPTIPIFNNLKENIVGQDENAGQTY